MRYPPARRLDLVEDLHGHAVADPYRWLEDAGSEETRAWSAAQDELTRSWLGALPGRAEVRRRLEELMQPGLVTVPVLRGDRAFFQRRRGDQQHPLLLVREADGAERVLVDPCELSPDATVTLDSWRPSTEGDLLAYWLSEGGDEESVLRVMDVATGETVDGPIDRTRYCDLAWLPGGGSFFYGRRLSPDEVATGEQQYHRRVYRHRLGDDPEADELVFGEGRDKTEYHGLHVSRDGRWLVVTAALGTAPRNDVYLADLERDAVLCPVQEGLDARTTARVEDDGLLYVLTDLDAPRGRIAVADPADPLPDRWRDLVPESEAVIEGYALTTDAVVVATTRHAVGCVSVHDRRTGERRAELALPGPGSVSAVTSRPEGGDEVWVGYTDFLTPPCVYRYSVSGGALELWEAAPGALEVPGVTSRQVCCTSRDGTEVRLFVLHREGLPLDGLRPTQLYGYGGFGVSLTPAFSASILTWVEHGGVYAVANLRGGGEEGEEWHRAGMRDRKQHVFDDCIAAAEHLVSAGYTSPPHLAVSGGSNGGLLVGAVVTQRPDLFAAAVCSAPLLDMVRYEHFGMGATWNDEYGSAADPEELGWLLSYSPYHHVTPGVRYPAVLFSVFESDTRVDPMHARKLCAALQWATTAPPEERPILYRREEKVGHGARSVDRTVGLAVDTLTFLAERVGLRPGGS